ncbi:HSP20-like chaperones superfamily protein [Zea mays]|uniref:Co-chaperone protein p23 n=1 Tax=Zea mays TaxID=4577 RepID=A0A1D6PTR2_MAIZE|nr:HSP20-like chaperones superfamily protein [Zea mays]
MNSCLYVGLFTTGIVLCSRHPEVKWAQRIDKVYITVQLPDAKDAKVNLEPDGVFTFSGSAGTNLYELKLDLNDKVNVEASKISVGVRSIFCIVEKAEAKWWKKLVRDDQRAPHFVKVDWDKWVDEDDDGADVNLDGMDFSNFGGMGGMGGMGDMAGLGGLGGMGGMGMDDFEDDSDEEEVSKPQAAGHAAEAEKTESAEAKTESAQSS